jgi:hypothetical protein
MCGAIYSIPQYGFMAWCSVIEKRFAFIIHKEGNKITRKLKKTEVFRTTEQFISRPSLDVNSIQFPLLRDRK